MRNVIINGRVLLANGALLERDVHIEDGVVSDVTAPASRMPDGATVCDADGALVLPGMVDLHGDAFERQLLPRPESPFPVDVALIETDRQLAANAITTAFLGVTYSWEPGLRGGERVKELLDGLERLSPRLLCDLRVHLRWEVYNLAAETEIAGWLRGGRIDLLAFNDHFDHIARRVEQPEKLSAYVSRTGLSPDDFKAVVHEIGAGAKEVPAAIDRLAVVAAAQNVTMASHDDETPLMRKRFHDIGCRICEFPLDAATADASTRLGDPIVLGGPNVVRDGSHCDRLHAAQAVAEGRCDILTSDYYYPSMLHAAFILVDRGYTDLADAWRLVSTTPARVSGLTDRGEINPGQRADIVVVDDRDMTLPRTRATFVAGVPAYISGLSFAGRSIPSQSGAGSFQEPATPAQISPTSRKVHGIPAGETA